MIKILQATLQQYMNREIPDVQAWFRKSRGTRDQTANTHCIIKKARKFWKKSTSALLTIPKPLIVWTTRKSGKFWKRWEYPTTWPASWEICMEVKKQVRTEHGTTDWFQIRKGEHQGYKLSPCLFYLYAEYIMWNARLDEAQAGIRKGRGTRDQIANIHWII